MENKGLINCPKCNKRIFADDEKCPYCKNILNKQMHNLNKEIYDFLYNKYTENNNKPETIKIGMDKFNMSMKEIKEIVDYIAEDIYHEGIVKEKAKSKEDLPTNGRENIEYNKNGRRKIPSIIIIGIIIYWIMVLFVFAKKIGNDNFRICSVILGSIIVCATVIKHQETLCPTHTYTFSFFQYIIHCFIPKIIVLYVGCLVVKKITNEEISYIFLHIISLFILIYICSRELYKMIPQRFTVDYGNIEYSHLGLNFWGNITSMYTVRENYRIYGIKEVKETLNSIIIYANIEKSMAYHKNMRMDYKNGKEIKKLKIKKSFYNNKNLIKSLKICAGQ